MDADELRTLAKGQWKYIISHLAGIEPKVLDSRHHPCPRCGGRDRFRAFDDFNETGGVICNQCHKEKNGDGFATLMWLTGAPFQDVLRIVAEYLNHPVNEVAVAKRIPLGALERYGAKYEGRNVVVPMYGADGDVCSHFTLDEGKGKYAAGKPVGLFLPERVPKAGEHWFITEGVKDASALAHEFNVLVAGLPTSALEPRFVRLFDGCKITIVPDRDKAGQEGSKKTAALLYGHADFVRICKLPAEYKEHDGDGVREILKRRRGRDVLSAALRDSKRYSPVDGKGVDGIITLVAATHSYIDAAERGIGQTSPTGIPLLDGAIGGVADGEYVAIGARPSHGKSLVALQMVDHASTIDRPGLIISEEMVPLLIGKRKLQGITPIPQELWNVRVERLREQVNEYFENRSQVFIAENCGTVDKAIEKIDRLVEREGIKVVAVDYIQLLRSQGGSRYEMVTNTSTLLRECANRNNITLLVLSQFGRDIEKRPDKIPVMADFKESGQIEQDADVILGLVWPYKFDQTRERREYEIHVLKNRNRETKEQFLRVEFDPSRQMVLPRQDFDLGPIEFDTNWEEI